MENNKEIIDNNRELEDIIKEYFLMWSREEPPSTLEQTTFIINALTTYREQGVREERERIKSLFPKLNPNSDSWGTVEMSRILKDLSPNPKEV